MLFYVVVVATSEAKKTAQPNRVEGDVGRRPWRWYWEDCQLVSEKGVLSEWRSQKLAFRNLIRKLQQDREHQEEDDDTRRSDL